MVTLSLEDRIIARCGKAPAEEAGVEALALWLLGTTRAWAIEYLAEVLAPDRREQFAAIASDVITRGWLRDTVRKDAEGLPSVDGTAVPMFFLQVELVRLAGSGQIGWRDVDTIREQLAPVVREQWPQLSVDHDAAPMIELRYEDGRQSITLDFLKQAVWSVAGGEASA
jgi:hypothetical protein